MAYVIDQAHCSCCHRCRVECPVGAIRFKGSKYWIDPDKCISCGHCAEVCHNSVITNPDAPATEAVPHEKIVKTCDVLVIGGGAAGMAAAARAADSGKKVIVLEKNKEVGGSAWYAHMFRSQWSVWHEAEGIPDPREKLYNKFMKETQGRVDGELVKNMLDADVDFVNWLIQEHDLGKDYYLGDGPFNAKGLVGTYDVPYNHLRIDTSIGPGGNGWFLCLKLLGILEENGGEVLYNTPAKHLLTDESGKVTGAIGADAGGEVEIHAGATIVTAGAFTHNKELMAKFQPIFYKDDGSEPVHVFTCATCTGDGITMCDEIGADRDYVNRRVNLFGPARHPFGTCGLAASRGASHMMVDPQGRLYNAPMEMTEVSGVALNVPERYLWSVLDQTALEDSMARSQGREPDAVGVDMDRLYRNFQFEIDQEVEWGSIKKADTLEGLADELGVDRAVFLSSVEEHNAHIHDPRPFGPPPGGDDDEGPGGPPPGGPGGDDEDDGPMFGPMDMPEPTPLANGPFYALRVKLFHENAVGGMATDGHVRVLKNGQPIPGLFAAGDNIRGIMLPGAIGVQYIESFLSALTSAFCGGYLAGEEAVKYLS